MFTYLDSIFTVSRRFVRGAALVCFGLWFVAVTWAQPGLNQDATPTPAPPDAPLTLRQVLQRVEINHPKLSGAEVERRLAEAKLLEKQAAFDPQLALGSDYLRFNSSSTRGKLGEAVQTEGTVEMLTRSGIKVFGGSRLNVGNVKSPLSSTGNTGEYFAGVKVPLMRDWGINPKSAAEQQALINTRVADTEFAATRLEMLLKAAESYWDWVVAKQRLDVSRALLTIANDRLAQVRGRVNSGDLPPIDSIEAEQEVQRRLGEVVKSERDLQKTGYKLSLFLWDDTGRPSPLPLASQVPASLPEPVMLIPQDIQEGLAFALEKRPELRYLALVRQFIAVDENLARNQRRPGLDLSVAPGRDTGDKSIGNTLKVGVTFSLPVGRRQAGAQLAAAQLKQRKIDYEEQLARQQITTEINDLASAVNAAYGRYFIAQREAQLARDLERGERTRFSLGDSTLFLVNQRERAAAETQIKLLDLRTAYEQALAAFRVATVQY